MQDIVGRLHNSHPNEGSHDLACRCVDAATEIERLRAALTELVELKALKDRIERHHTLPFHEARRIPEMKADYERRKPLAWEAARKLVPNEPAKGRAESASSD